MKFTYQVKDGIPVAVLNGGANAVHVDTLRRELTQWVDGQEEAEHFVLDFQDLQMMDSSGLGALVGLRKRIVERGGTLHIAAVNQKVRMVFHVTRTAAFFRFHDTTEKALTACNPADD